MSFPDYVDGLTVLAGTVVGGIIDAVTQWIARNVVTELKTPIIEPVHVDDVVSMAIALLIGVTAKEKTRMLIGVGALGAVIAMEITEVIHYYIYKEAWGVPVTAGTTTHVGFLPRLTRMRR